MNTFKRFLVCSALILAAGRAEAYGVQAQPVVSGNAIPTGYLQFTATTSTGFTPPTGSLWCNVTPETQAVRYRTDGVAPTASVGMPLATGVSASFRMSLANLTALRFIGQVAGAVVNVDCYKDQ